MGCEIKSDEQRQGRLGTIPTPFSFFFYLVMLTKYTFIYHTAGKHKKEGGIAQEHMLKEKYLLFLITLQ